LQIRQFPMLAGVIGKFVIGKLYPGNNLGTHC
jgi:hypothetical protein